VAYSPANFARQSNTETVPPRALFAAVTVLGLVTYCVSFGPVVDGGGATGWFVRFAALAGLIAAYGLLPKGKPLPLATAVLAAMGFLDALSLVLTAPQRGWALTAIVVLNAVQTAVAVAALLLGPKEDAGATAGYEAYVDYYNQAVRNYYSQQAQSATVEQMQSGAYGDAEGHAQAYGDARAQARRPQRESQYGDYADLDHASSRPATPLQHEPGGAAAQRSAGLPNVGHTQSSAQRPEQDGGQTAWPSSPA
jgi:hypothetical protein